MWAEGSDTWAYGGHFTFKQQHTADSLGWMCSVGGLWNERLCGVLPWEESLRSDIQSFKYFRSLSSKLKFYFRFSVLHRGRKSRVGHTKSHPLSSVSTQVPFASSHTFVRTTTHPCQFKGSLFKLLTGKESTGNVGAFSRESPKQSRVQ